MVQIGFLIMAAGLIYGGIQGLRGAETEYGKLSSGVSIAMIVVASLLIAAAIALPFLI